MDKRTALLVTVDELRDIRVSVDFYHEYLRVQAAPCEWRGVKRLARLLKKVTEVLVNG